MDPQRFEEIINIALDREREAYEFYRDASLKVVDETTRAIFETLANEEKAHEALLTQYKFDNTLVLKFKPPAHDYHISEETDAPSLLTTKMKPSEAVALAMKKELQAVAFYKAMADHTDDEGIKKALLALANMEENHKVRLEDVFVQIGFPESF